MIRRIVLRDFMSHAETVIEPADGLTVLVGPNNSGKSAIVEALRTLCTNENSTHVKRHGARECCVTVETDDGHVIEWRRRNSPSYVVDAQLFDRLGRGRGGVPPEVHEALRLPWVEGDGGVFDVHLGEQKTPIFLLEQSGSHAARFFASSSDATKLVEMQRRHREKGRAARGRKQHLEAEASRQTTRIEQLGSVPALATRMEDAETLYAAIRAGDADVARLESEIGSIAAARSITAALTAERAALATLNEPPSLLDRAPLERLAVALHMASEARRVALGQADAVSPLRAPLELDIRGIARTSSDVRAACGESAALSEMIAPPTLGHSARLDADVRALASATAWDDALQLQGDVLSSAAGPPELRDDGALAAAIADMRVAGRSVHALAQVAELTRAAPKVPAPSDALPLVGLLGDLARVQAAVAAHAEALEGVAADTVDVATGLRAWANANSTCPTCGAAIDADALVAHAADAHGGRADG
jgi:exonuclease SbcC